MEKKYKYDAFISYRHCDLDKYVAENLHRLLETYKMPKAVAEKYNIKDSNIRRVFRDQEELPLASNLEAPILQALKESNFLIVICSPRLKESIWCKKEIENFIKFHGREKILCILVEKEPIDSFPEELLYQEVEIEKNGKKIKEKVPCEPLAMDVRGNNKKEVYRKLKTELIRLIAPMYNLDYDDIKRRHEERELKKKVRIFRTVAFVSLLFAIYSFALFFKIYTSSNQLKYDQAISLADSASNLLENDNRPLALKKAYESVTKYNHKTARGIYELTDSLGVYYNKESIYPISQLDTKGIVKSFKASNNSKYLLSYDNSNELVLWDLINKKRISTITDIYSTDEGSNYSFIDNNTFIYQNNDKELVLLDTKGKTIKKIKLNYYIRNIVVSNDSKYIVVNTNKKLEIYDINSYKLLSTYTTDNESIKNQIYFNPTNEYVIFCIEESKLAEEVNDTKIITYSINSNKVINIKHIKASYINKMIFKDNNIIVQSNRSKMLDYTMLVTNYNYKNGNLNYEKEYKGEWAIDIAINSNILMVASYSNTHILDLNSGNKKSDISIGERINNIYPAENPKLFLVLTKTGEVHIIDTEKNNDIIIIGLYNLKLNNYEKFLYTEKGLLGYTNKDNRIIIYDRFDNKDIKTVKYENKEFKKVDYAEKEKIIKKYNFKNKNLISDIAISDDKKYLFVSYTNDDLEIYDTNSKKLLNTVKVKDSINVYLGKTKNNEYIVKGNTDGYILNKKFELIAYIPNLYDYKNGNLIINKNSKYYEVKIYSTKELIKLAKEKLDINK